MRGHVWIGCLLNVGEILTRVLFFRTHLFFTQNWMVIIFYVTLNIPRFVETPYHHSICDPPQ